MIFKHYNHDGDGLLNVFNRDGFAPIHLAVFSESIDILNELVSNSKYLNIADKKRGYTALHYAASKTKLVPMVNLLAKNTNIDVNVQSFIGTTPLHIALANKNYMSTICLVYVSLISLFFAFEILIFSGLSLDCKRRQFVSLE